MKLYTAVSPGLNCGVAPKVYEAATLVLQSHANYGHYGQSPDIPDILKVSLLR